MLKNYTILILVLLTASVGSVFAQKTNNKVEDEAAIRANVEQMVKGWNAKSGAEFAKPFAEDADYVVINGMHIKSRTVIAESHQRIFDTFYANSTLSYTFEQLRFLRPDVAVVHVKGLLKVTQENSARTSSARITLTMTKDKNKWEIAAFQNTEIQAVVTAGGK